MSPHNIINCRDFALSSKYRTQHWIKVIPRGWGHSSLTEPCLAHSRSWVQTIGPKTHKNESDVYLMSNVYWIPALRKAGGLLWVWTSLAAREVPGLHSKTISKIHVRHVQGPEFSHPCQDVWAGATRLFKKKKKGRAWWWCPFYSSLDYIERPVSKERNKKNYKVKPRGFKADFFFFANPSCSLEAEVGGLKIQGLCA